MEIVDRTVPATHPQALAFGQSPGEIVLGGLNRFYQSFASRKIGGGGRGQRIAGLTHPLIFHSTAKVCAKALFWLMRSMNCLISGSSRVPGMLGINS